MPSWILIGAKEKGSYKGGRPSKAKSVDLMEIKGLYAQTKSHRRTARRYNETRYKGNRISRAYVARVVNGKIRLSQKQNMPTFQIKKLAEFLLT